MFFSCCSYSLIYINLFYILLFNFGGFPGGSEVKASAWMRKTQVQSLGREDPLEKEMATHSSILAWRIPWREEPGRLQFLGSQRVGHDWATSLSLSLWFIHFYYGIVSFICKYHAFYYLWTFRSCNFWRYHEEWCCEHMSLGSWCIYAFLIPKNEIICYWVIGYVYFNFRRWYQFPK